MIFIRHSAIPARDLKAGTETPRNPQCYQVSTKDVDVAPPTDTIQLQTMRSADLAKPLQKTIDLLQCLSSAGVSNKSSNRNGNAVNFFVNLKFQDATIVKTMATIKFFKLGA